MDLEGCIGGVQAVRQTRKGRVRVRVRVHVDAEAYSVRTEKGGHVATW